MATDFLAGGGVVDRHDFDLLLLVIEARKVDVDGGQDQLLGGGKEVEVSGQLLPQGVSELVECDSATSVKLKDSHRFSRRAALGYPPVGLLINHDVRKIGLPAI